VFLTDEGRHAEQPVTEVVTTTLERMTDGLDDDDTETFKRILGQVLANATR